MRDSNFKPLPAILAVSAMAIAISVVYQSFFPATPSAQQGRNLDFVDSWQTALPSALPVGGTVNAPVTVLELADLECPACKALHTTLKEIASERPGDVQILYVSYPLEYHRFALPAARGAECAFQEGLLARWLDVVYLKQDSLGLKPWEAFATEAGIRDPVQFEECVTNSSPVSRIEAGLDFGAAIGVVGVPTVLVNGWRFPFLPSKADLNKAVDALLTGRTPN